MSLIDYFKYNNESGKKCREAFLKKNRPDIYNKILNHSKKYGLEHLPFKEQIYCFINNIAKEIKCKNPYCNNKVKYLNLTEGYLKHCSKRCNYDDPNTREKIENTNLKKYGVKTPTQNEDIKNKVKNTNIERYGVEHLMKDENHKDRVKNTNIKKYGAENPMKNKDIKDKLKNSNIAKYGVDYIMRDEKHKNKIKHIFKEKYGVENPFSDQEIKNKIKNTNIEKYGVKHPMKNKDIKNKIKHIFKEKYGVENPFSDQEIKNKIKNTNIEKYGTENPMENKDIKNKIKKTNLKKRRGRLNNIGYKLLSSNDEDGNIIKCTKGGHFFNITNSLLNQRIKLNMVLCTECNPINSYSDSSIEILIYDFIENELGVKDIIKNDRTVLNGKELDIYIPEKNLAIEFNGSYWHNELFKEKKYHLNKTNECKERGVQLIHIFEDEWIYKPEIVKSMIKNKLGRTGNKVHGRKCEVHEITTNKAREFCEQNHLQGFVGSSVKLGLFHGNELVSVMTFGKLRKPLNSSSKDNEYEMLRFCNKLNTNVTGGANKLLKYFVGHYNPNKIITYADKRYSNGGLYEKLGFQHIHDSNPNYFYVINTKREYRFKYRKDKLVREGFDPNKSEHEIMLERGIYRIYDCGNKKYEWNIKCYG